MRLLKLHLLAYGPFTDFCLDLSAGDEGLHVVFGPNEAGKSTALRALRALLFGIPERTRDDFRHEKTELRIGGVLQGATGEELTCYRRKGRQRTLLDSSGEAIADKRLRQFLGGVDEPLFVRLFGIDHEALVNGGQALLAERGREAEALFGAGLGSSAVHTVLDALGQETQSLFLPRGSKPLINAGLAELKEIRSRQRDVSLSAKHWDEARTAVEEAHGQLRRVDQDLAGAERRRNVLQRLRRTMPSLAKRAQLRLKLADMGEVPVLDADFGQRREAALSKRVAALARRSVAMARLEDIRSRMHQFDTSHELLVKSEVIVSLRDRLSAYSKAMGEKPALVSDYGNLEERARQKMAEIRPDASLQDVDQLRPLVTMRRRCAELGERRAALESTVRSAQEQLRNDLEKLSTKRESQSDLPKSGPFQPLCQAVTEARRVGDLDFHIIEADAALSHQVEGCERGLSSLGLWAGSGDEFMRVPLPAEETIRSYATDFETITTEKSRRLNELEDIQAEQVRTEESLRTLRLTGSVPTEAELQAARKRRDREWTRVRRRWVNFEDPPEASGGMPDDQALLETFEKRMAAADEIADRLRREAQRVHEQAAAEAKLETCRRRAADVNRALRELTGKLGEVQSSWRDLWMQCDISPWPPSGMLAWLENATRLREAWRHLGEQRAKVDELVQRRELLLGALGTALAAFGKQPPESGESAELKPILEFAESYVREIEATESRRAVLRQDIEELEQSVRSLQREAELAAEAQAAWKADWSGLMTVIGRDAGTLPGEASDHLQSISEVVTLLDEARRCRQQVKEIDSEIMAFEGDAKTLLTSLAPDLLEVPIVAGVLELHARYDKQKQARSRVNDLNKQAQQAEGELRQAKLDIEVVDVLLAELCRQAGCQSEAELQGVEQRFDEYRRLRQALDGIERELMEEGDGFDLRALEAEASAADRDSVIAELDALTRRIDQELRPQREKLLETKLDAEQYFRTMTGGDDAAQLADRAQQTLAALRGNAERYQRLRLATRVLRDEIEQFRQRHRDPILGRASNYFGKLTCGSMTAIDTEFDGSDRSILVGVRPSGERLSVEAMSTGSRDQLYLALRLATLEHYFENLEPLPFIVDDILIQFDDWRMSSTLEALVDFSSEAQVILFTHHKRVVQEATDLANHSGQVFVHELTTAA